MGPSSQQPRVAVLVGSPRRAACWLVAREVVEVLSQKGLEARLLHVGDYAFEGCCGCGSCSRTGRCVFDAAEVRADRPGHAELRDELLGADALALVAPVYFGGPPSRLKAAFDRFQPLWAQRYVLGTRPLLPPDGRKPFDMFVLGCGGDPFGYESLVTCSRSALRMADFELREVHDLIGFETRTELRDEFLLRVRSWAEDLANAVLNRVLSINARPHED